MTHSSPHEPEAEWPDPNAEFQAFELQRERIRFGNALGGEPTARTPSQIGLSVLHRASMSQSLLRATGIRARRSTLGGEACDFPVAPEALRTWRTQVQRMLLLVRADLERWGEEDPKERRGLLFLERLLEEDPGRWPSAVELTLASIGIMDQECAHVALGFAHLMEGEPELARDVFQGLLCGAKRPEQVSLILEGLGYAHLMAGDLAAARASMESAAERQGARVSALAWSLNLAFCAGSSAEIERAALRLDMLVASTSTEFAACLAHMRGYWSEARSLAKIDGHALALPAIGAIKKEQWARECRSSSGRVARAMG